MTPAESLRKDFFEQQLQQLPLNRLQTVSANKGKTLISWHLKEPEQRLDDE